MCGCSTPPVLTGPFIGRFAVETEHARSKMRLHKGLEERYRSLAELMLLRVIYTAITGDDKNLIPQGCLTDTRHYWAGSPSIRS